MPLLLVPAVADVVPREAGFVMEGREEEAHQGLSLGVIFWMRRGKEGRVTGMGSR